MPNPHMLTIDGNQAAAIIAHKLNEVIAIYPITPASPMGEWADRWSAEALPNLWGTVPQVIEMQSEGGAAGVIHGALQAGSLTTTFTASQGLLLMIPNMYKIAGELLPTVFHIASRSLAAQALSIFGDHSDVMTARMTGFAMLCSNSPQEVMDFAVISQAVSLEGRIPMLHFFDGFRTSHEIRKLSLIDDQMLYAMLKDEWIAAHRARRMSPEHPVVRGTSQNPDIYFQARETVNPYYHRLPAIMQQAMDRFARLTGRQYQLFDYLGHSQAEKIIILMGSGAETVEETVRHLTSRGDNIGMIKVRLYRPFSPQALLAAIPARCKKIAVLDRTKEPGSDGEPLYKDVLTAIAQDTYTADRKFKSMPLVVGGRYGLSSKEFTPAMVKGIYDELKKTQPKNHFTVGIHDDVSFSNLNWDPDFRTDAHKHTFQAIFYGLGSDGTVSANKNSIKIIGEQTDQHVQGYFVYDSKKAGAVTVSHLRFGPDSIRSTYLIEEGNADFVACHQTVFLQRYNMLTKVADHGIFLLNSAAETAQVWDTLPAEMQRQMIDKQIRFYTINAYAVAEQCGLGQRINTIMQTCFFALSDILPREEAIAAIKAAVKKTYGKKGSNLVEINFQAIDESLAGLHEVQIPDQVSSHLKIPSPVSDSAPAFIKNVTAEIIAGRGDDVPVSLLPADGTFPVGTAAYEKRNLALEIPILDAELCSQCGKCPLVCPHAAIRSKIFPKSALDHAPDTFKHAAIKGKGFPEGMHITYQVAPEDCTGCGLCVEICPIRDKANPEHKALNMEPQPPLRDREKINWEFFLSLPEYDRRELKTSTIKGAMVLQPLFEFSGACLGCGETPYIKLATQLFGDRMVAANATGCSSIYGGNLPTTPWTCNAQGRGPAWNNSLFEDNAEFGLGIRVAIDKQAEQARELLTQLHDALDQQLIDSILDNKQASEAELYEQRQSIDELQQQLKKIPGQAADKLSQLAENLCKKSVWIIGGDGWAYDIGYGGLDHALASGYDINILVLDTEVYSNTGGQTSKATPRGAVAKFSAAGKPSAKKDLSLLAMAYENVYVAHVALGAKDIQTLRAFVEAEAHQGPSIIIAYSPCGEHGIDLSNAIKQEQLAVESGHWPLFRYNPEKLKSKQNPMHLDSKEPSIPYAEFMRTENRFSLIQNSHTEQAEQLMELAQQEVTQRYHFYKQLSEMEWDDKSYAAMIKEKLNARA